MKRKRLTAILAIELTPDRLRAVEMRVEGEAGVRAARTVNAPLALNVFSAEPDLSAREIRAQLDAAGVRARACALCLPVENLLIQRVDLTGVPEEDVDSLIALEAERAFPFAPDEMLMAVSRGEEEGKRWATLAAVPASHLAPALEALRRAKLRVASVTPGVAALLDPGSDGPDAVLLAGERAFDFACAMRGGIAILRSFHFGELGEASEGAAFADDLQRELRMTLRRLPKAARESLRRVRVFEAERAPAEARAILEEELAAAGLAPVSARVTPEGALIEGEGAAAQAFPELARAAAGALLGRKPCLEFWRPREDRWRVALRRLMARGILVRLGLAAGIAAGLLILAFAVQVWRAGSLERRWARMKTEVETLESIHSALRDREPWLNTDPEMLGRLLALTEAFPETGSVWVRSIEMRAAGQTECQGFARNTASYLETLRNLRSVSGVEALQVGQVKGGDPIQFSFQYRWNKGASNE